MTTFETAMMILLLIMGAFLVVSMLLQKSKKGMSRTISGGAETYYGRENADRNEKLLSTLTTVVGIAFVCIVLLVYVVQPNYGEYLRGDEWQEMSEYFEKFTA